LSLPLCWRPSTSDRLQLSWRPYARNRGEITDFAHGADRIDVSGLLSHDGYSGANPIADGYLKLIDDGHGGAWLDFDTDGHGTADPWGSFGATADHVSAASFSLADFIVR
jgi:hypothetical protein